MKYSFVSSILIIGGIILTFSGCRKETLREENSNVISSSQSHCFNGILDGDEVSIDCGGTDCTPCNEVQPNCTVASNTLVDNATSYSITGVSSSVSSGVFTITGTAGSIGTVTIKVIDAPNVMATYGLTTGSPFSWDGTVSVPGLTNASSSWITVGDLFFNSATGCYTATVCGSYSHYWTGATVPFKLSITCP